MKIIFSDIDRCQIPTKDLTLINKQHEHDTEIRDAWYLKHQIEELQRSRDVMWIHNSARSFPNTLVHIQGTDTQPDILVESPYVIASLGTEIYKRNEQGTYDLLQSWQDKMDDDFPPSKNTEILALIHEEQQKNKKIGFQPQSTQSAHKVALHLTGTDEENKEIAKYLDKKIARFNVKTCYSHGHYYDITPKGVDKGTAVEFMIKHLNAQKSDCIACGDSGGDTSMFKKGMNGILPSNADNDLRTSLQDRIGKDIFLAEKNKYALGLIEGLRHFGVLPNLTINPDIKSSMPLAFRPI